MKKTIRWILIVSLLIFGSYVTYFGYKEIYKVIKALYENAEPY